MLARSPAPRMVVVTVTGSPAATSSGAAFTSISKRPTAPVKSGGRSASGSGSTDSATVPDRRSTRFCVSPKKPKKGSRVRDRTSALIPMLAGPIVSAPVRSGVSVLAKLSTSYAPSRRCAGCSGSFSIDTPSLAIVGYWSSETRTLPTQLEAERDALVQVHLGLPRREHEPELVAAGGCLGRPRGAGRRGVQRDGGGIEARAVDDHRDGTDREPPGPCRDDRVPMRHGLAHPAVHDRNLRRRAEVLDREPIDRGDVRCGGVLSAVDLDAERGGVADADVRRLE